MIEAIKKELEETFEEQRNDWERKAIEGIETFRAVQLKKIHEKKDWYDAGLEWGLNKACDFAISWADKINGIADANKPMNTHGDKE